MIWKIGSQVAMNKAKTRQFTDLLPKRKVLLPKGFTPPKEQPIRRMSNEKSTVEWRNVNWRKLEKRIFKLQKRIYRASSRGDVKAVRKLQVRHEVAYYAPKCAT